MQEAETGVSNEAQIANEVADLAIVAKATAHEGEIHVGFKCDGIPESFNAEMLSKGYAVATAQDGVSVSIKATYKNITDF